MPKRKRRDHRTDGSLAWDVEEKFSRGQRQFETCDDWMLPDEQSLFAADAFELEDFMLLKSDLNSCKSKLNDVEIDQWHMHTKRAHAGGVIVFSLREQCNAELCTQAWVKFYEVLVHHSLVTLDCEATFTVHLCEAPGAFITALNHYLRADGRQARWNWLASTLNPYHGANTTDSMVDDDRFIQFTRDNWFFCDDDSGNLMLASNIASIRRKARELAVEWLSSSDGGERCGKDIPATSPSSEAVTPASSADSVSCCDELGSESDVLHHDDGGEDLCFGHADLVTADGSVDCQDVPAEQESHVAALHFCEVVTSLGLLKRGGALVVKMFTLLEHSSVCLLYLLNCTFDEVHINKPVASKAGNSEVYVVCKGYRGVSSSWLKRLTSFSGPVLCPGKALFPLTSIPSSFVSQLFKMSKYFASLQMQAITDNIRLMAAPRSSGKWRYRQKLRFAIAASFLERFGVGKLCAADRIVPSVADLIHVPTTFPRADRLSGSYTDRVKNGSGGAGENSAAVVLGQSSTTPVASE